MLCHLDHQLFAVVVDLDGVEQLRQLAILKLDVQHRADDLEHLADMFFGHRLQLLFDRLLNLRAGHDLSDLLRDGGLTGTVIIQVQMIDHLTGVLGGGIHGGAAGGKLT